MGQRANTRTMLVLIAAGLPAAMPMAARAQDDPLEQPWDGEQTFHSLLGVGEAWRAIGVEDRGLLGISVAAAGDVNGDGVDDAIFGAPQVDADGRLNAGEAYVVFGVAGRPPALLAMSDLDGDNGFVFRGRAFGGWLGEVGGAGDLNGDGIDDVIIGASLADASGSASGESYVVFGRRGGFPAVLGPDDLDGTNGFSLPGAAPGDRSGDSVAGAGDLNGDGVDDAIIGASGVGRPSFHEGGAYVVFGSRDGFDAVLPLADLDGTNGFLLAGAGADRTLGNAVAAAGDVNGDGVDDVIVGDHLGGLGGSAYVVFGRNDGFAAVLSTSQLDGTNGFAMRGSEMEDLAGAAVAGAVDLNGDGIDDVAVGAPYAGARGEGSHQQGYAYVVFGRRGAFPASIALGELDGGNGFRIEGATSVDTAGKSLAGGGDLNGDGFDDLIVGAPGTGYSYACYFGCYYLAPEGSAFVIYGRDTGFDAVVDLADASADGVVRFDGLNDSAMATSLAGRVDFNADGRPDIVLGAIDGLTDETDGPGAAMVIYGRGPKPCEADLDGDGDLTIFDFLAFQNLFDAGDPAADFDGDGSLTLFDFLAFQNAFDAGCP